MRVVLTAIIPWDYASQGSSQRKQYKERSEKEEEVMEFEAIYLSEKVRCLLKRSEAMTNQRSSGLAVSIKCWSEGQPWFCQNHGLKATIIEHWYFCNGHDVTFFLKSNDESPYIQIKFLQKNNSYSSLDFVLCNFLFMVMQ
ncbi:unnamed protein product [Vicia faba]|uniref:Uncharacterized protein n=1 Tax=Vicia faba TaxID=3906 RepID=A0AAV0Z4V8_VICFA|nr:unnamed protein product [Vicia faba]